MHCLALWVILRFFLGPLLPCSVLFLFFFSSFLRASGSSLQMEYGSGIPLLSAYPTPCLPETTPLPHGKGPQPLVLLSFGILRKGGLRFCACKKYTAGQCNLVCVQELAASFCLFLSVFSFVSPCMAHAILACLDHARMEAMSLAGLDLTRWKSNRRKARQNKEWCLQQDQPSSPRAASLADREPAKRS